MLDASQYGPACPQAGFNKNTAEDCLTLNVWAPDGANKLPVLFYIHGGSFCRGSGNEPRYDGRRLAEKRGVVVVTVNYRLGALGFMDFSAVDPAFKSNCGLSDVTLALKWVYENIEAFGGDSSKITIAGQSAGATMVSVLMTIPSARQYISRAIMMSGTPSILHTPETSAAVSRDFMDFMGISSAEELRNISARELTEKQNKFIVKSKSAEASFSIVADGELVKDLPTAAATNGAAKDIPLLIGTTKDELSLSCTPLFSKMIVVKDIVAAILLKEKKAIRRNIVTAYRKHGLRARSRIVSDHLFKMSSLWFAQACAAHSNVWMYSFDYSTCALRVSAVGACHSSDIPYLFGNMNAHKCAPMFILSPSRKTIDKVAGEYSGDFTDFVKTGELPWQKLCGDESNAKHYDGKSGVSPVVDEKLQREYDKSEYKKHSVSGLDSAVSLFM